MYYDISRIFTVYRRIKTTNEMMTQLIKHVIKVYV